jgi:hypothetical protein
MDNTKRLVMPLINVLLITLLLNLANEVVLKLQLGLRLDPCLPNELASRQVLNQLIAFFFERSSTMPSKKGCNLIQNIFVSSLPA